MPATVLAAGWQQAETSAAIKAHLPSAEWAEKLREMADKIAAVSSPPSRIELTIGNVSSLDADEIAGVDESLRTNLLNRRMRIVSGEPVDTQIHVTVSEGVEGYLIVAEIRRGDAAGKVFVIPVPKSAPNTRKNRGVALDASLIWEQPEKILDFALPPPSAGEDQKMIVLEAGRIAFYVRKDSQWQLGQSIIIPPLRPWLRAPRGRIDFSDGIGAGIARIPGIDCQGDFAHPDAIQCGFVDQGTQSWNGADTSASRNADIGGDAARVSLECDGRPVMLATGKDDWTETDFIQGYEAGLAKDQETMASGKPIEFEGPVTSLWWTGTGGIATAVAKNLKTGNYEAYIVTATCSH